MQTSANNVYNGVIIWKV